MNKKTYSIISILIVVIFFSIFKLSAQESFAPETFVGARMGYGLTQVSFDPAVKQDWQSGMGFGIAFSHISQKSLGIYAELNISQAGWKTTADSSGVYSRRLNYLQFPLLTQINIGNRNGKVLIHLGPCFSYLLSESENTNDSIGNANKPFVGMPVKNKFDYGLCVDLGFFQKTNIGSFQILARYNQSLGSIFETAGDAAYRTSLNTVLEVSLGYFIEPKQIFKRK